MRDAPLHLIYCDAYEARIWIAGPFDRLLDVLAEAALDGACYSVERTVFVYTGGREDGATVRIINYGRFPKTKPEMWAAALKLAKHLIVALHQGSCTVQDDTSSAFISRRGEVIQVAKKKGKGGKKC